jgi:PAS domain S-box-containing protein
MTNILEPGEISFGFDELFFSRTDAGGIIKYGNSVFQSIAGYDWDQLLEKPHKIIRHGDMPRAVFWLLWDTIKQGKPIGAFVKNRAKDGRFYWVYAIVTPTDGGYLSVRLRPSSEVLSIVAREYAALAEVERREKLAPADSAALLLARLRELGFATYAEFMATALGAELAARDKQLNLPVDKSLQRFAALGALAKSLIEDANRIAETYAVNESVPFNFRVLAAQLGQDGAAIGVISSNYSQLSGEMKAILARFIVSAEELSRSIGEGAFLTATARVQHELLNFFTKEVSTCPLPREPEMDLLDAQERAYRARANAGLNDMLKKIEGFQQACAEMTRLAAGLEVTRIMGKVECSRHTSVKDRLDELLADLEAFQKTIASTLKDLDRMNASIRSETQGLIAQAA